MHTLQPPPPPTPQHGSFQISVGGFATAAFFERDLPPGYHMAMSIVGRVLKQEIDAGKEVSPKQLVRLPLRCSRNFVLLLLCQAHRILGSWSHQYYAVKYGLFRPGELDLYGRCNKISTGNTPSTVHLGLLLVAPPFFFSVGGGGGGRGVVSE